MTHEEMDYRTRHASNVCEMTGRMSCEHCHYMMRVGPDAVCRYGATNSSDTVVYADNARPIFDGVWFTTGLAVGFILGSIAMVIAIIL